MAVSTVLNSTHITGADAIASSKNKTVEGTIGYTDRGTRVVESNTAMGQNSFLKLLVAQMKNLDPSKDQDSTAYITQMAEFASIEQLNNLNTSISDFANQQKVGQVAILNEYDSNGQNKWGIVTQIFKNGTTTYATVQDTTTGELTTYDIKKIIGSSDSGYSSANFETALNSKFSSASTLAKNNSNAVIMESVTEKKKDENGNVMKDDKGNELTETKVVTHKVQITGAYLDKQNSTVKVQVVMLDENGKPTEEKKEYSYDNIAAAGTLDNDALNEIIKNMNTNASAKAKTSILAPVKIDTKSTEGTQYYPHEANTEKSEKANENTSATEKASENTNSTETNSKETEQEQKDMKILEKIAGN